MQPSSGKAAEKQITECRCRLIRKADWRHSSLNPSFMTVAEEQTNDSIYWRPSCTLTSRCYALENRLQQLICLYFPWLCSITDHQCTLHTAVNAQILESNAELEGHSMAHTSAQAQTVALNKRRIKLTLSCGVWLGPHIRYSRSSHIDSCHHYCSAVYAFTTACRINA